MGEKDKEFKQGRREFFSDAGQRALGIAGAVFLGLTATMQSIGKEISVSDEKSNLLPKFAGRVVRISDPTFKVSGNALNSTIIEKKLNEALKQLTRKNSEQTAWGEFVSKKDVVGIKLNCLAGRGLSPHPELVSAIVNCLKTVGVKDDNIILFDRTDRDLTSAGFEINRGSGVKCFGNNQDFESEPTQMGSVGSCLSLIFSKMCSVIINVGVLKDHDLSGVSVCMKNLFGLIHNPNKYHFYTCNPYLADLVSYDMVRKKVRLNICDSIIAQYHGGPSRKTQFQWQLGEILVSSDIVAIDSIGAQIIEEKRKEKGMRSLKDDGREPIWLKTSEDKSAGIADLKKVEVINL